MAKVLKEAYLVKEALDNYDVDYLEKIIAMGINDEEKAQLLHSYCSYDSLIKSLKIYKEFLSVKTKRLEDIVLVYEDYKQKGYFEKMNNKYNCDASKITDTLAKLTKVYNIFKSNLSDYDKGNCFLDLFNNKEEFIKIINPFIQYKDAPFLINYQEEIEAYSFICEELDRLDDIISNIAYTRKYNNYFENYNYAKFIISSYINDQLSYLEDEFYLKYGIDKDIFNECLNIIQELDVDLYHAYESKLEDNQNNLIAYYQNTIKELAYGITNGYLPNNEPFDMLYFIQNIPFVNDKLFLSNLFKFMNLYNKEEELIIKKYINENRLIPSKKGYGYKGYALDPISEKSIYKTKTIIKGRELSDNDKDTILDYIRLNNIPFVNKAYVLTQSKYIDGQITKEEVDVLRKERLKTIIPGKGR